MPDGFQNVTVETVTETVGGKTHKSIRLTLKSTNGSWVIDVADGESPMATIETPSGAWHDVVLGSSGDIIVH